MKSNSQERYNSPESSEEEYKRQKQRLLDEWHIFCGIEKEGNTNVAELTDNEFIHKLYDRLMEGVDLAIKKLNIEVDYDDVKKINQENTEIDRLELQIKFIESVINQMQSVKNGGKLKERSKEDISAFYPARILETKGTDCSGAAMMIGRIFELAGMETYHGIATGHAVTVVRLADHSLYYVDSKRRSDNVLKLDDELIKIGSHDSYRLNDPLEQYRIIIVVPTTNAVESVLENYSFLLANLDDGRLGDAVIDQMNRLNEKISDINLGFLAEGLFPQGKEIYNNDDWIREEESFQQLYPTIG